MKTMIEYLSKIISNNRAEIENCNTEIAICQKKLKINKSPEALSEIIKLKDKIIFHQGSIFALEELKTLFKRYGEEKNVNSK